MKHTDTWITVLSTNYEGVSKSIRTELIKK